MNLAQLTADDGVLFGSTVLGEADHNVVGRVVMAVCNRLGVFDNAADSESALRAALSSHFDEFTVQLNRAQRVAFFIASRPRR